MAIPVSSGTHPRLEISALQQDEEQFSLFIQALNNIMDHDYKFEGSDAVNWQQLGVFDAPPFFFFFLSLYLTLGNVSRNTWNAIPAVEVRTK